MNSCNYFNVEAFNKNQSERNGCDRILNGLFLGSSKGFVEATTLNFPVIEGVTPVPTQFTNKYKFKSVITMCPMRGIEGDFPELDTTRLPKNFSDNKITWMHPGKDIFDSEDAGFDLAFNATFPNSDLILESLVGQEIRELPIFSKNKKDQINKHDVQEWFEPVFAEMDKAILGRGNTLVHCQAGVSRSATVVAAYLINRFDLPAETAIDYLKTKRACVNPKFGSFLNEYATRLKQS